MRTLLAFIALIFIFNLSVCSQEQSFDIPIFAYHRFGDSRYPSTNISDDVFSKQLKYLKDNKFHAITFGEAEKLWRSGKPFPKKAVIITIDDGYLSFYTHGWPLLKEYGFKATIFIQTETVGGGDFMNWSQIREIEKAGIEIGNHSASHAYFVNLSESERKTFFTEDLLKSNTDFESRLGYLPEYYAYPYGEFTKDMEAVLKQQGIKAALVQQSGVFSESSDPYAIPRFPMGGGFGTLEGFINKISMKAMRVSATTPDSPFFSENPPTLKIEIVPGLVDLEKAQFFVQGTKVEVAELNAKNNPPYIIIKSDRKLDSRRTLYTLTAPSLDGNTWHWFSHLWIRPEVNE